ncbi:AbrB/MazE/SpoVT family DNA-binding domain-containing protein [Stetteria hydrogenophila]
MQQTVSQRKVQKLGSSSLIITIPKAWAHRMKLKPGDNVVIIDDGDSLRIAPSSIIKNGASNKTLRISYTALTRTVDPAKIIRCAYYQGYKRVVIESIHRFRKEMVEKLEHVKRGLDDVIKNVSFENGDVVIEFKDDATSNKARALKEANSVIQSFLDLADFKVRLNASLKKENAEGKAKLHARLVRSLAGEPPRTNDDVATLINIMIEMALSLLEYTPPSKDSELPEIIGKLKLAVSEALGGLASESLKRVANAADIADAIIAVINNKKGKDAYYGLIYGMAIVVKEFALKALCRLSTD